MRFLLDTHALIWFIDGSKQFSETARTALEKEESEIFVSIASIWEMAIKISLGKLRLRLGVGDELREFLEENGFEFLGIEYAHVARVASLPFEHKDPFDRLLVAQSLAEKMALVSQDEAFDSYGVKRVW